MRVLFYANHPIKVEKIAQFYEEKFKEKLEYDIAKKIESFDDRINSEKYDRIIYFAELPKDDDSKIEEKEQSLLAYINEVANKMDEPSYVIIVTHGNELKKELEDEILKIGIKTILKEEEIKVGVLVNKIKGKSSNENPKVLINLVNTPVIKPFDLEVAKSYHIKSENGLRFVSDDSLQIANILYQRGNIRLKVVDNKVRITSKINSLCDYKTTTEELLKELKKETPMIGDIKIFSDKDRNFNINLDRSINFLCEDCKYQICPKHVAAYVSNLIEKEVYGSALEDRKKFRQENDVNDNFNFIMLSNDGLKKVPDEIFQFSKELVDKGCIYVDRNLRDNQVVVNSSYSCLDYKILNCNKNKIQKPSDKFNNWHTKRCSLNTNFSLCKNPACNMDMCIYSVAGYLYYLNKIGKKELIEKDREYYNKNKEKIDEELKASRLKRLENVHNQRDEYISEFEECNIENIEKLIDLLLNMAQQNLFCTIEGEDSELNNKAVNKIVNILKKTGKIASNPNVVNRVGLYTLLKDKINIESDNVYVLDGTEQFTKIYKRTTNVFDKNALENLVNRLCDISKNNYIILTGTTKQINEFVELDAKLKYVFSNYRFVLPDISIDEMFELFLKTLKPELLIKLNEDLEKNKSDFYEYVSLNNKTSPLTSRKFADYLAMYCNANNKLEFPNSIYKNETLDESLSKIIGLDSVKEKIKEFEKYVIFKMKAESLGMELQESNMHMVFTGNPGTGKTTVARLMVTMLFNLGIIKENKLVEVERKDLIGEYIGQTAPKIDDVVNKAIGGVLFIDEAYTLTPKSSNDFGSEAIATLIKAMEDHKGDLVVIFAGYKDEMRDFIDSNPGIASRIGYTFDFPDYTPKELLEILNIKFKRMGFELAKDTEMQLKDICEYFSKRRNFGNGRFIDKLIQEIIFKHSSRDYKDIKSITIDDIPSIEKLTNSSSTDFNIDEELDNIVGMDKLKGKIKDFQTYVKFLKDAKEKKINVPSTSMHMVFTGNPGTGKTTIARIMAKILFDYGLLHENKLVEVERKDLIGQYVGQTAPKTSKVIEEALGGVLFIDEAYTLTPKSSNDFGSEAIATIIKAMEDYKGELVVIFAGYENQMKDFINSNPGISSRIGYTFDFPDYTAEELTQIYCKKIDKYLLSITDEAKSAVLEVMKYFESVENIGNGRFVDKLIQETLLKHSKNYKKIELIDKADIPTIKEMTNILIDGDDMIDVSNISEESIKRTAIHEIGHATVMYLLGQDFTIKKITIRPEGTGALGYVQFKKGLRKYTNTKEEYLNKIKVDMAGIAAEKVFLGDYESGGGSDLENATNLAKWLITKVGMSKSGFAVMKNVDGQLEKDIYDEINDILKECFDGAIDIITKNKKKMENAIEYLIKNKEINESEFIENFK